MDSTKPIVTKEVMKNTQMTLLVTTSLKVFHHINKPHQTCQSRLRPLRPASGHHLGVKCARKANICTNVPMHIHTHTPHQRQRRSLAIQRTKQPQPFHELYACVVRTLDKCFICCSEVELLERGFSDELP